MQRFYREKQSQTWALSQLAAIFDALTSQLEKAMAPPSSTLAWQIPWMEKPGRLQSMGSLRVGHDWATSLSLFTFLHWRRKWQPTPVFLPGESQGRGTWWAAVSGVAQSRTRLKRLNSSSSNIKTRLRRDRVDFQGKPAQSEAWGIVYKKKKKRLFTLGLIRCILFHVRDPRILGRTQRTVSIGCNADRCSTECVFC